MIYFNVLREDIRMAKCGIIDNLSYTIYCKKKGWLDLLHETAFDIGLSLHKTFRTLLGIRQMEFHT